MGLVCVVLGSPCGPLHDSMLRGRDITGSSKRAIYHESGHRCCACRGRRQGRFKGLQTPIRSGQCQKNILKTIASRRVGDFNFGRRLSSIKGKFPFLGMQQGVVPPRALPRAKIVSGPVPHLRSELRDTCTAQPM
jgi:hypothetical protein